jgi:hypothetical protein
MQVHPRPSGPRDQLNPEPNKPTLDRGGSVTGTRQSHLNPDQRNGIFVTIGAGETYATIRYLLRTVALKRIPVATDVVLGCKSWFNASVGHEDERYLRSLIDIDAIVAPRLHTQQRQRYGSYRSTTASSKSSKPDPEPER